MGGGVLTEIFASLLATGELLKNGGLLMFIPYSKRAVANKSGNYRPVSITSVVGKLLEKTS